VKQTRMGDGIDLLSCGMSQGGTVNSVEYTGKCSSRVQCATRSMVIFNDNACTFRPSYQLLSDCPPAQHPLFLTTAALLTTPPSIFPSLCRSQELSRTLHNPSRVGPWTLNAE
jgi:hypothetical protein